MSIQDVWVFGLFMAVWFLGWGYAFGNWMVDADYDDWEMFWTLVPVLWVPASIAVVFAIATLLIRG